jgi:FkbM family methyltransferase
MTSEIGLFERTVAIRWRGVDGHEPLRAQPLSLRAELGLLRSLVVYWRPGRQRGLRRLYGEFIRPGDLVFDVGAHLGDRSVAFAALGARVIALEPQPRVAGWLRRIVGRNPNVTVLDRAVGAAIGTSQLAISHAHPTVSTLSNEWRLRLPLANGTFRKVTWPESVEVDVTTLDALIEEFGEPNFCKIDVEGFEAEVLAGLTRPIPALSVEFVQGALGVAVACIHRLQELADYEFNVIPGESRNFALGEWTDGASFTQWVQDGADGMASGDLYARLARDAPPPTQPESLSDSKARTP